jgi:transcriptional regulator with XRE-family HTH domain
MSERILSDIEKARRASYDPATLVRLERALNWPAGHIERILAGFDARDAPASRAPVDPGARGPLNARVSANVALLRRRQRMPMTELEQRTADAGCRIPRMGLDRVEAGQRRITLDEAAALAHALGVSFEQLVFTDQQPNCGQCSGMPPAGFRCLACGADAGQKAARGTKVLLVPGEALMPVDQALLLAERNQPSPPAEGEGA